MIYDVIIIGAGPAGLMSAIVASENGHKVALLDKNEKVGKKLYITGKGRCNVTNNCDKETFLENVICGKKFLYGAINAFSPQDVINFFETNGLKLKTERGNRVFPESDKSSDVIKILEKKVLENKVDLLLSSEVESIKFINNVFNIKCSNKELYTSYSVIVATGGKSYSATGSNGDGYKIAKKFGHNIIVPKAGLVPIILTDKVKVLEGLSLKNVRCEINIMNKKFEEFGEMMFTDNGVTGPIILTLSSKINSLDLTNSKLYIDFKPALSEEFLDEKLLREIVEFKDKDLINYLKTLLPTRFVLYFMDKAGLKNKKVYEINKVERKKIVNLLKRFDFSLLKLDNIDNAIITSGGVDLKEVNPKTMESKLQKNLYFAGEVLDCDALTGGFNLQIAFSTGFVAGQLKG